MKAGTSVTGNEGVALDAPDERRPSLFERHERPVLGTLAVAVVLAAWEGVSRSGVVNPIFLSSPTAIAETGARMAVSGELSEHLWVSGVEFLLGYVGAVLTAVPVGLVTGWYRRVNAILDPFIAALYATPRIALLPLIILWVGVGIWSKVTVIFLGAFFPICVNVLAGVKTVDQTHLRLARSFQSDELHVFKTIILPSCVPFILAGLRLAVGRALVGVVVAELFAASAGIGFLIVVAGATFQTDKVFVGITIIGAFGMLCNELLSKAERRVQMWRPKVGAAV